MRPTTRTSSRTRSTEKPPTSWRSPNSPDTNPENNNSQHRRRSSGDRHRRPASERAPSKISLGRPSIPARTKSNENELIIRRHVTRDSMLENILLSFDQMNDVQGPFSKQPPLYSSFKDGEFKLDTPCFVYDARSQVSTRSRSSSTSPNQESKPTPPSSRYQIRSTPVRRSSLAQPHSAGQLHPPNSRSASSKASHTPKPRPYPETEAMSSEARPRHSAHGKGRTNAMSMDLGTNSADRAKWSKRRSGSLSTQMSGLVPDMTSFKTAREFADSPAARNSKTFKPPIIPRVEETTSTALQTEPIPQPAFSIPPIENFRPQLSSRKKVASVAGSSIVLANGARPSVSDARLPPHISADTREPQFGGSITSPKRAKSQPFPESPREQRPGFFKRVFGSTRSIPTVTESPRSQPVPSADNESNVVPATESPRAKINRSRSAPDTKPQLQPPSTPVTAPPVPSDFAGILRNLPIPSEPVPVLNKKASFFRRRRKPSERDHAYDLEESVSQASRSRASVAADEFQLDDPASNYFAGMTLPPESLGVQDARILFRSAEARIESSIPSTPVISRSSGNASILISNTFYRHDTPPAVTQRQKRQSSGMQTPQAPSIEHVTAVQRSTRISTDADVFQDATPISLPSAQLQTIRMADVDSPPVTPIPSPMSRPEYPASLQGLRASTGLAITTNVPMTIHPHYDGNHNLPTAPPASRPISQIEDSPGPSSRRIWIQPEDSDEEMKAPLRSATLRSQIAPSAHAGFIEISSPAGASMSPGAHSTTFADTSPPSQASLALSSALAGPPPLMQSNVNLESNPVNEALGNGSPTQQLGQAGISGDRLRQVYMELLDLKGVNVLNGLRLLCGTLTLKGESQQIDRILSSFSRRWCECNRRSSPKLEAIVNNITYALLLLNTDLHIADLDEKMSRAQFVKNTMSAIRQVVYEESDELSYSPGSDRRPNSSSLDVPAPEMASNTRLDRPSLDSRRSGGRLSVRPSARPASAVSSFGGGILGTPRTDFRIEESADLLLTISFDRYHFRMWEAPVEALLKTYYNSIKQQSLPLFSHMSERGSVPSLNSSTLQRSNSNVIIPPESGRGRVPESRSLTSRWTGRNRSKVKVYGNSINISHRPSVDDVIVSPTGSSIMSKTMSRTQTSLSSDSIGDNARLGDAPVGFASALSQAIVRGKDGLAATTDEAKSLSNTAPVDEDVLMLAGPPWTKEGIVHHKHFLEATGKKAKDRGWVQCFAVVDKGSMGLFSFTSKASTRAQKNKPAKGAVVGGGNWTDSAESLGSFTLRQTLAAIVPPPGHKGRPHVFSIHLPSGAVHFFQVGTAEIADEFVNTINYWSARLSKEPWTGGVDNIEYGWSEAAIDNATFVDVFPPSSTARPSASEPAPRSSFQGSVRNSFDSQRGGPRAKKASDRLNFAEWTPPAQNLNQSALPEPDQLMALERYLSDVKQELALHTELRPNLTTAYGNRNANRAKVMTNWEKRSAYLQAQITKFSTYVDSLQAARLQYEKLRREKEDRAVGAA